MSFGTENGPADGAPVAPPITTPPATLSQGTVAPGMTPATTVPPGTAPQAGGPPAGGPPQQQEKPVVPTRTGMVWVSVCAATLLAIALIVFLAQNTKTVRVHFLGLSGSTSLALMMLIAAVAGMLITVIIGSARIIQLRRRMNRR